VKRECYSLGGWKGQTEKAPGVGGRRQPKLVRIIAANGGDLSQRICDPHRLVSLPAMRHRREVGRIGLDQKAIARHHSNQIGVRPLLERHDAAEGDAPTRRDREFRQGLRTGVAVQDSGYSGGARLANCGSRIVLRVACVDDYRALCLVGERNLGRERGTLRIARRVVVVVVETALTHCDRASLEKVTELRDVALGVERCGVVRVNARGRENEAPVFLSVLSRQRSGIHGFADADDRGRARIAGAADYRVAVAGERCVREVGVAVDEACRAPVLRGHLRSIQRRTGAAT
jgi:hypothetical protein